MKSAIILKSNFIFYLAGSELHSVLTSSDYRINNSYLSKDELSMLLSKIHFQQPSFLKIVVFQVMSDSIL